MGKHIAENPKLKPHEIVSQGFTLLQTKHPTKPLACAGNASGHYILEACGVRVPLKGNGPLGECVPTSAEQALEWFERALEELRARLLEARTTIEKVLD